MHNRDVDSRMAWYLGGVAAAAAAAFAVAWAVDGWRGHVLVLAALCAIAAVAERGNISLSSSLRESISLVPTLFAAVLFGPVAAMLVALASMLPELRPAQGTPSPLLRWGIYSSTRALTASAMAASAALPLSAIENNLAGTVVATSVGAVVGQVLDASFAALTLRLRRGARIADVLRDLAPLSLSAVPLYTPVVACLAFAYNDVSPLTLPLFFVPALAAQRLYALYQAQRQLTDEVVAANEVLGRANLSFASALVATLDARDHYTAGHSAAVAIYAQDIARRMELSAEEQEMAYLAGLVHDIGKIGLPAGLLEKPGALTLEERRRMEDHAIIGERILANVDTYATIAAVVRHHHERVDGAGYPDGLNGDAIPLLSRIIAVADAYNAMTSDRPYRDAMPSRIARLRLAQAVGSQFDTSVVAAFEAILASRGESYRSGQGAEFGLSQQVQRRAGALTPRAATA